LGEVCIQSLLEDEFQLHFHTPDVRVTCGPASTDSSYVPWLLGKICCGVAWHGKREACDSYILLNKHPHDFPLKDYLVGGDWNMALIFHVIKKGCHPPTIDFHSIIFQDG
jgi:hypothetical protein